MATNPFDQFDAPQANPFNQFDATQKSSGILGPIRGAIEAGAGLISGMVTAPIVEGAKIYGTLTSGKYGTPEGIRAGEEFGQRFQQNFYQPRTDEGRRYLQAIGEAAARTGMQGVPLPVLADFGKGVAAATRAAPLAQQVSTAVQMPFEKQIQARREAASLKDYARGPQIDAAAEAQRLGIAVNPTDIEPSVSARFYSAAAGPRGPEALANANKNQVRTVVLNEMDLPLNTQLNGSSAFSQARAKLSTPYNLVKKLPIQQADDAMVQRLEGIRTDLDIIGAKDFAPAISKIVDDAISKTQSGLTGEALLKNIRVLRERARKTYGNKSSSIESLDIADTNLKIATELESMIDNSISNPKLLSEYRDARQKMARTYAYEGATDFNTGMVDVSKLARITAKDSNLTGDIASLGKIGGNFPDVFTTQAASKFYDLPRLSRSGLGGGAGALLGSNFGLTGSIVGGLIGGGVGEFGGKLAANRMANPNYQAGLNLSDMRIPVNQMAAAMQPIPQNRAVVPYEAPVEVLQPGQGTYFPDFVLRPSGPGPLTTPGVAPGPAQIGMSQGPVGGQMGALRIEDVRARDLSMRQGAAAESQQAAAAAAGRQPTGQGTPLMFDSAGNLVEVPIGGSAVSLAPTSLESAVQKLSGQVIEQPSTSYTTRTIAPKSGAQPYTRITKREGEPTFERGVSRAFDLTAEERIAWEKTKVGLATAAPEFKGLTDKALASKLMDQKWIQDTITKARERARGFDEIAARGANNDIRRAAVVQREILQDGLDALEETLRRGRPVSGTGQGPKTRAAKANQLSPREVTNAMEILGGSQ